MNIAAVIFDMDGVLADSQKLHHIAERETYAHFDIPITEQDIHDFTGMPDLMTFWEILKKYNMDADLAPTLNSYKYGEAMPRIVQEQGIPPIEGVQEVVEIATAKYPCAVASSSTHEYIILTLQSLGLLEKLPVRMSIEDLPPDRGKPHPDIYLLAAKKLEVDPKKCIAIEDAAQGIRAAKSAGMFCIGYKSPHSGDQDLSHADTVIEHMEDAIPYLEGK